MIRARCVCVRIRIFDTFRPISYRSWQPHAHRLVPAAARDARAVAQAAHRIHTETCEEPGTRQKHAHFLCPRSSRARHGLSPSLTALPAPPRLSRSLRSPRLPSSAPVPVPRLCCRCACACAGVSDLFYSGGTSPDLHPIICLVSGGGGVSTNPWEGRPVLGVSAHGQLVR